MKATLNQIDSDIDRIHKIVIDLIGSTRHEYISLSEWADDQQIIAPHAKNRRVLEAIAKITARYPSDRYYHD